VADATLESQRGPSPRLLREKDLEHHLKGEGEKPTQEKSPDSPPKTEATLAPKPQEDPPLDRALELLKTWQILNKVAKKKVS